ncbi:hypothetical protein CFOL_v3_01963 [Cephalotus follicularis]|uniref:Transposase (putative) gypsy type domain-containing protein n=1 Tax=Cephalotus follicularis TaxID=3775 RepID=A0A1Q3ARS9_CEPFO|nr:hypothetical protein CFOL_v3_01963 [Cephalotus follicularis]
MSILSHEKVIELARKYCFPGGIKFNLPKDPWTVMESEPGFFVVFEDAFSHGLRVPVPSFAISALRSFGLHPSLLQPQSWSFVMGFMVKCIESEVVVTVNLFREFHVLSASPGKRGYFFKSRLGAKKLLINPTKSMKHWKGRYFLIKNLPGFTAPRWCDFLETHPLNKRSRLSSTEKTDLGRLLSLEAEEANSVVLEDLLIQAGLSVMPGQVSHLSDADDAPGGGDSERGGNRNRSMPVVAGESCIKTSSPPFH